MTTTEQLQSHFKKGGDTESEIINSIKEDIRAGFGLPKDALKSKPLTATAARFMENEQPVTKSTNYRVVIHTCSDNKIKVFEIDTPTKCEKCGGKVE